MAVVKKISELTPKGANLANNDLLIVGVSNGTDYDLKSVTGAELLSTAVAQTITNGVTTTAPSQDAVYDALQNKVDKVTGSRLITSAEGTILSNTSGTNTGDETSTTIKSKLGITTLSGSNTGDQNLQQVTTLGADTPTTISVTGALYRGTLANATIQSATLVGGKYTSIDADGKVQINTSGSATGVVKTTNLVNTVTLEFPNKSAGSYTIATSDDLSTKVDANSAITGATKTKITYDSKGLVTAGADATTADIADSLNKRYVTDANLTTLSNTSGTNTGDETATTIKSKLGITTLSGSNTGDQIISDATLTTSDITTNNVSITKHGFAPKAPNDTTQFLRGDGTWATPSAGGLTYFTEAQSTTAPNATVNVDSLTAVSGATNADFAIRPKGTGAILARIPDNASTGGNKRGAYAVDLQTYPGQTYVASGDNSVIAGGSRNTASASYDNVLGGDLNSTSGSSGFCSIINGNANSALGNRSTVINGQSNSANGSYATVLGGYSNSATTYAISGGILNTASGSRAVAFGDSNTASGLYSVALNANNTASADYSNARGSQAYTFTTYTKWALSCGGYGLGASQKGLLVLNNRTTGNTPTELAVAAQVSDARNQMTTQDNTGMRVKGSIIGKQSGSTNIAAWDFDYIIVRGVGVGTTTVVVANVNVVSNIPAWGTPTITADTARGYASIKVTGATATNIQWTATLDSCEVIYA